MTNTRKRVGISPIEKVLLSDADRQLNYYIHEYNKEIIPEASKALQSKLSDPNLLETMDPIIYTANLYFLRRNGEDIEVGLGGKKSFDAIAGKDIDRFITSLVENKTEKYGNREYEAKRYHVLSDEEEASLDSFDDIVWAKHTVWTPPCNGGGLELNGDRCRLYLPFLVEDYSDVKWTPTDSECRPYYNNGRYQKPFFRKILGKEADFDENLKKLRELGMREIRVWFPSQNKSVLSGECQAFPTCISPFSYLPQSRFKGCYWPVHDIFSLG